jgi:hypothetical protein
MELNSGSVRKSDSSSLPVAALAAAVAAAAAATAAAAAALAADLVLTLSELGRL